MLLETGPQYIQAQPERDIYGRFWVWLNGQWLIWQNGWQLPRTPPFAPVLRRFGAPHARTAPAPAAARPRTAPAPAAQYRQQRINKTGRDPRSGYWYGSTDYGRTWTHVSTDGGKTWRLIVVTARDNDYLINPQRGVKKLEHKTTQPAPPSDAAGKKTVNAKQATPPPPSKRPPSDEEYYVYYMQKYKALRAKLDEFTAELQKTSDEPEREKIREDIKTVLQDIVFVRKETEKYKNILKLQRNLNVY